MRSSVRASLFAAALIVPMLVACAADEDAPSETEEAALSRSESSLVAEYKSKREEDVYATSLELESDGTFTARLNKELVGAGQCTRSPCVVDVEGRWKVASRKRITLMLDEVDGHEAEKDLSFDYELETEGTTTVRLSIDKVVGSKGIQELEGKRARPSCPAEGCPSGKRCVATTVGSKCVSATSGSSCSGKRCGESCGCSGPTCAMRRGWCSEGRCQGRPAACW